MANDIIYKVTLSNGVVKIGSPQRLAGIKGAYPSYGRTHIVKVERAINIPWTDASGRHIEGYEHPEPPVRDRRIAWTLAAIRDAYGPPEG